MTYNWKNYTVLVAEDDPMNYRYIELLLSRRTGINLIWAKNGLDAVNICRTNKSIDLVLLDLQLPELDGLKSLKKIKESNAYLPVIIQTANSWNNERNECIEAGADGFFNKPLHIDLLLSHMSYWLETYSIRRQEQLNSQ